MNSLFCCRCPGVTFEKVRAVLFFILLINTLFADPAGAARQLSNTQSRLDEITKSIEQLHRQLAEKLADHAAVKTAVTLLDKQLGALHRRILASQAGLASSRRAYRRLQAHRARLIDALASQERQFQAHIQIAYASRRQSRWKLILSQASLQQAAKNALIYDYIHQARRSRIEQLTAFAGRLRSNQQALEARQSQHQAMLDDLHQEQAALHEARRQKQQAQAALAQTIKKERADLQAGQNKKRALQKLLKQLKAQQSKGKFASQAGRLHWPVTGKLRYRFGEKQAGAEASGVLIDTAPGAPISAVYAGQVIFADWLDHYGWLLIIDHGNDFMSLYAHAEGLYKRAGDYVTQGERIAVAGNSGAVVKTAGLYFEIRRRTVPVDPARWCVYPAGASS